MAKTIFFVVLYNLASMVTLWGQCISRDSLWNRLIYLAESDDILLSTEQQLSELLNYETALPKCSYRYDSTHALLLQRIGALYLGKADYLTALQYTKQSIQITISGKGKAFVNPQHLVKNYFILSVIYGTINMVQQKMAAIDNCMDIALQTNSVNNYALYALKERVEYLFDIGDYERASKLAEMGESMARATLNDKERLAYALNFVSWKVNVLVNFKEYELAQKMLKDKITECVLANYHEYLGTLYEQLAIVQSQQGIIDSAFLYFHLALKYHKAEKSGLGCQQTLTNLGIYYFYRERKDYNKSIVTYRKALAYIERDKFQNEEYSIEALNIYANIANAMVRLGRFDSAFYYFQRSFDQIKPGGREEDVVYSSLDEFVRLRKIQYLIDLLIDKGDAYLEKFKKFKDSESIKEAIRVYKSADQLVNRIKDEQSEIISKLYWRNNTHALYEHAIEACYLSGNIADAFYFFEKSRAVLLNDQLYEQANLREAEILHRKELKKKIVELERELREKNGNLSSISGLREKLYRYNQKLDADGRAIKSTNPGLYNNLLGATSVTIQDVQTKLLKQHTALIEIFSGTKNVYAFIITAHQAYILSIDKIEYEACAELFLEYISDKNRLNSGYTNFVECSRRLYQLIFQEHKLPAGRIIISPDGHFFPYEALITSAVSEKPVFFLKDFAVSYTYSARYLLDSFFVPDNKGYHDFIGVAPVHFEQYKDFASLTGSDGSLDRLKSYFQNADNLILKQASKSNFLRLFSRYKIVQLYTHATASGISGEPEILFADSILYLSDLISAAKPITNLIVLSACETGKGKFYQGEGVFSFNRGFAVMGIPSSITNLWSVENVSTYRLTELFYKNVSKGLPIDVSLQEAKIEFMQNVSSEMDILPTAWAATILVGKTESIEFNKPSELKKFIVPVILVLGFVFWLLWRLQKRQNK